VEFRLDERVAYGRAIRARADCLIEAYGDRALEQARQAAVEPGLPAAERSFWDAVADRIVRATTPAGPTVL
jgi:hypothetical protein